MKRAAAALAATLALCITLTGCAETKFEKDCKTDGGTVQTDREDCGTKTTTTGTGTKKKTTTSKKHYTEYECIVDGAEVRESEGPCS